MTEGTRIGQALSRCRRYSEEAYLVAIGKKRVLEQVSCRALLCSFSVQVCMDEEFVDDMWFDSHVCVG
jgi:hypothetical protein